MHKILEHWNTPLSFPSLENLILLVIQWQLLVQATEWTILQKMDNINAASVPIQREAWIVKHLAECVPQYIRPWQQYAAFPAYTSWSEQSRNIGGPGWKWDHGNVERPFLAKLRVQTNLLDAESIAVYQWEYCSLPMILKAASTGAINARRHVYVNLGTRIRRPGISNKALVRPTYPCWSSHPACERSRFATCCCTMLSIPISWSRHPLRLSSSKYYR